MQSVKTDSDKSKLSNNEQCYICKRTESEVRGFLSPTIDDANKIRDSELAKIESQLENLENIVRSHLDGILKSTEKCNLDFRIYGVTHDIDSFKKIIPRVEDLMKYADKEYDKPEWEKRQTLLDVRNNILQIRKNIDVKKIYQIEVRKNEHSSGIIKHEIRVSDAWKPYVSMHRDLLNSEGVLRDLLETFEMNLNEKNYRSNSSENHNKVIETTKHKKITRQLKSITTHYDYELESDGWGKDSRSGDPDVVCTTDFSFYVCAICYTLIWHKTDSSINSIFHEESKPVLREGEKFVRVLKHNT